MSTSSNGYDKYGTSSSSDKYGTSSSSDKYGTSSSSDKYGTSSSSDGYGTSSSSDKYGTSSSSDGYGTSSKYYVDPPRFDTFTKILIGAAIFGVIILIGLVVHTIYRDSADEAYRNGFQSGLQKLNSGPQLRFFAEPTDTLKVSGFTDAGARTKALWKSRQEPFSNSYRK